MFVCDGAHPWQLAHSSNSTETSSRAVRVLRVMTTTSCPLLSHDATPLAAAAPDLTTPASGPHHTPLTTGAMTHHTVGGEDIGQVPAGKKQQEEKKHRRLKFCHFIYIMSRLKIFTSTEDFKTQYYITVCQH